MEEQKEKDRDSNPLKKWASLRWFIHIVITRRVGSQSATLLPIYAQMIRELNNLIPQITRSKNVLGLTLYQTS